MKADAIKATLEAKEVTNMIPATIMKDHKDFILYIDADSAKYVFPYEIK